MVLKAHKETTSPGRLSEKALFPQLFVMPKKLSSEYQLYTCGNFFRIPQFEKKLLFSDSLLVIPMGRHTKGDGQWQDLKGGRKLSPGIAVYLKQNPVGSFQGNLLSPIASHTFQFMKTLPIGRPGITRQLGDASSVKTADVQQAVVRGGVFEKAEQPPVAPHIADHSEGGGFIDEHAVHNNRKSSFI